MKTILKCRFGEIVTLYSLLAVTWTVGVMAADHPVGEGFVVTTPNDIESDYSGPTKIMVNYVQQETYLDVVSIDGFVIGPNPGYVIINGERVNLEAGSWKYSAELKRGLNTYVIDVEASEDGEMLSASADIEKLDCRCGLLEKYRREVGLIAESEAFWKIRREMVQGHLEAISGRLEKPMSRAKVLGILIESRISASLARHFDGSLLGQALPGEDGEAVTRGELLKSINDVISEVVDDPSYKHFSSM